jgi:hypothetical protein
MIEPQVLEGTWEELSSHADEFKGHKLRLIVLPDNIGTDQKTLHEAGLRLLEEGDTLERVPGEPLKNSDESAWGEGLEEMYRKMGLKV